MLLFGLLGLALGESINPSVEYYRGGANEPTIQKAGSSVEKAETSEEKATIDDVGAVPAASWLQGNATVARENVTAVEAETATAGEEKSARAETVVEAETAAVAETGNVVAAERSEDVSEDKGHVRGQSGVSEDKADVSEDKAAPDAHVAPVAAIPRRATLDEPLAGADRSSARAPKILRTSDIAEVEPEHDPTPAEATQASLNQARDEDPGKGATTKVVIAGVAVAVVIAIILLGVCYVNNRGASRFVPSFPFRRSSRHLPDLSEEFTPGNSPGQGGAEPDQAGADRDDRGIGGVRK